MGFVMPVIDLTTMSGAAGAVIGAISVMVAVRYAVRMMSKA